MHTYIEMSLPSVVHIDLLIHITCYCAALPVPGLEEGGGGNHVSNVLRVKSASLLFCCLQFACFIFFHRLLLRICVAVAPFKASAITK